jgi:hypothetical protein
MIRSKPTLLYSLTLNSALSLLFIAAFCCKDEPCVSCPTAPPILDSTSHNYFWQLDTLTNTQISSSILRDVAIINDTTIWAVGNMFVIGSEGHEKNYNLAVWNGKTWRLEDVLIPTCNDSGREIGASGGNLMSVFAYSASNIWLASAGSLIHWNGTTFERICNPQGPVPYALQKIWGATGNTVYMIGPNGLFARYVGGVWQKIFTGTDIDLKDIWGTANDDIWIAGEEIDYAKCILLHFDGVNIRTVYKETNPNAPVFRTDSIAGFVTSVWTDSPDYAWITTSSAEYRIPSSSTGESSITSTAASYGLTLTIRGSRTNNIFVAGFFGTLAHYNGNSWWLYKQFLDFDGTTALHFRTASVRERMVVLVGRTSNKAVALIGKTF